jgi:6-carboxyhexanoate--CoA ligase
MRASDADGRHLCGAERIVTEAEVAVTSQALWHRARACGAKGQDVVVTVDSLPSAQVEKIPCLPVLVQPEQTASEAIALALLLLSCAGVGRHVVFQALQGLTAGLGPGGGPLRGAALMDARSGKRLEADIERGVRASHFDYTVPCRRSVEHVLETHGLTHFRTLEALAVASKVQWAGEVAEWCWSDDPDYEAGYLGLPDLGYVRFPRFKPPGAVGGRVFFLGPGVRPGEFIRRLEEHWTLIDGAPNLTPAARSQELLGPWIASRMGNLWTN